MITARRILPPVVLALSLVLIYLGTMAPGLTWANGGTDGGDLITATATGGVAHPTGYPTYMLIAGLFQALPMGTLAFRTNLLSAVAALFAALLVYGTITWLPNSPARGNKPAGLVAGFMFGLAPLVWSQAVITEVYTLHAFFVALIIFLAVWIPTFTRTRWMDLLLGVVLGLAIGNHLTSLFLIPVVLIRGNGIKPWKLDWSALGRSAAGLAAGLLVYTALPLRALNNAPVNWGNPVTLPSFSWLVSGALYQRGLLAIPITGILQRLQESGTIILQQIELAGVALALIGLIYFFKPSRLYFITLWNALAFTVFSLLYGSADSYLYLIPLVLSAAVWAGLGFSGLINATQRYFKGLKPLMFVLFCLLLAGIVTDHWPKVNAAHDDRAERFGAILMASVPQGAILLAQDDASVFTLWYFHYALKQRPDLVVLARDLLHFSWYDDTLRATYPAVSWPQELFWPETVAAANPDRPVCSVSYALGEKITCNVQ